MESEWQILSLFLTLDEVVVLNILDIHYDNISFNAAVKQLEELLKHDKNSNLFFLNADCLYKSQIDNEYRDILNSTDLVLPDGIALALIMRIFGGRMKFSRI